MDKKSAMQFVQMFVALRANAFDVRVKCLHSDGEFKGHKDLDAMCAQSGIIQEFSTTETPQLNGEAERLMRTLVDMGAMCQLICGNKQCIITCMCIISLRKWCLKVRLLGRSLPSGLALVCRSLLWRARECYFDEKRRQTKAAK